jgi:WbqC-like protein family
MQPYFFPYAGYFRLLAAADTFVIFDDVQFPRRGRVHRCEAPGPAGALEWLTLPLARQPHDILIKDLAFAGDARAIFDRRLQRLPWLVNARGPWAEKVRVHLNGPLDDVVGFLERGIRLVADALGLQPRLVRSSALGIDRSLRAQDRVIAIVRALNAHSYINAPGGRTLYHAEAFHRHGLDLRFLAPYTGDHASILPALVGGDIAALRASVAAAPLLAAS